MPPKTSVSNTRIDEIFSIYKLATKPTIRRITVGFTNEIHQVDNYIIKIYVRPDGEKSFDIESAFYKNLYGEVMVPKLVVADKSQKLIGKPFIIYKIIQGEPLGNTWHTLTDSERKNIIRAVCEQIKLIRETESKPQLEAGETWQQQIVSTIGQSLELVHNEHLLSEQTIAYITEFVETYQNTLGKQVLALTYWDVHLDNIIVNKQHNLTGLIDFEHVDVVSIDYLLNNIRRLVRYPHLTLSPEMEDKANAADYEHLMEWFEEYYPELFDFPELERRIDLYELADVLRQLPRFPKAQQLHDRISSILQ